MMKALLTTCLLLTLLYPDRSCSTLASLICYQCIGTKQACNNPLELECAEGEDNCVSFAGELVLYNYTFSFYTKTCTNSKYCETGIFRTVEETGFSTSANVRCCNSDLCNGEDNQTPPNLNLQPNGLECPSCFDLDADHCQADDTVACLSDESVCYYVGLTIEAPEDTEMRLAYQSCGTPDLCQIPTGVVHTVGGSIVANIKYSQCSIPQQIDQQPELNPSATDSTTFRNEVGGSGELSSHSTTDLGLETPRITL
ncbi:phospholipase A2 inhibitor gamma subunit B-like [Hemicordylus capensis]|uniref:phospholipase A2 inhibitor gamma subunit B-like n=1 Tax=Hemicordylus capensis TaxID=884348 RepID=UPI002304A764|nr:phospholipase A2 inhibitor gamma subunit B-like [Hemicordylus capensis]